MAKESWAEFLSRCEREIGFDPLLTVAVGEDGFSYLIEMGEDRDLLEGAIVCKRGSLYLVFVGDPEGEGKTSPEEYRWVDLSGYQDHPGERVVMECSLCDWERQFSVMDVDLVGDVSCELEDHVADKHGK